MHTLFFRSFYLIFSGLFATLFVAALAMTITAARRGDPPSTIASVAVAVACAALVVRSLDYMNA